MLNELLFVRCPIFQQLLFVLVLALLIRFRSSAQTAGKRIYVYLPI